MNNSESAIKIKNIAESSTVDNTKKEIKLTFETTDKIGSVQLSGQGNIKLPLSV